MWAAQHYTFTEPKVVTWEPGQGKTEVDFVVDLTGQGEDDVAVTAAIDDDALNADNRRHLVLAARDEARVLLVDRRSFGTEPDLDRLSAGQWIRRALRPADLSPVDVIEVDPAALDVVDVRGVDSAVLPRPDLLTEQGWSVLRAFVDAGGLLIVLPPTESNVHQWTDQLATAMNLPWRISLEVVDHEPGLALADEQPASEWMRLLSGDMEMLVRPVLVYRSLPVDLQQTQAEGVLKLADGSPLVIVGSPRAARTAGQPEETDEATSSVELSGGLVAYVAVSPELSWTNLPAKPLMVPLFHELIRQGIGLIQTSQRYRVGDQPALGKPTAARVREDTEHGVRAPRPPRRRRRRPDHHRGIRRTVAGAFRAVRLVRHPGPGHAGDRDGRRQR